MRSLWRLSFCISTMLFGTGVSAAADLASAGRAYQQKDYATAFKELMPLAEQGNPDAQLILGKMYLKGQGVLKDPDQAIHWFKASAVQGNADAQLFLGSMYLLPHKDIVQGLRWLWLAAKDNLPFYKGELASAERQMTTDQMVKGRALAAAWKPQPGLKPEDQPQSGEKSRQDGGRSPKRQLLDNAQ